MMQSDLVGFQALGYNTSVEEFRDHQYPMLKDAVYLDHAGTTLYSKSLLESFVSDMTTNLFGNPHSASQSSQLSTSRIEDIRLRVLQFFNADPTAYDVVFVANATAGIKLVADAMRALPGGFDYVYHQACHTSLVGVREEAQRSTCLDDGAVEAWLSGKRMPFPGSSVDPSSSTLFAYSAQSNMSGQRFPLSWLDKLRRSESDSARPFYTMLDAAAHASTSPLDLGDAATAPDFTVISFYKIFGFPNLGAVIVRRQAECAFNSRRYFGGGTVDMVVCKNEQWHASKKSSLHDRLEDGTLPVHNIVALEAAMDSHHRLYGSMSLIASHTSFLARRLYQGLSSLYHANGTSVCTIYSLDPTGKAERNRSGPIVAFNIRNAAGAWVSLAEVEKLAALKRFHIRTGGVCNPGGIASALGLEPWEMKRNFSSGFRCGNDYDVVAGKPTGVVRVSLGAMSTVADVDSFIAFVDEFYRDDESLSSPSISVSPCKPERAFKVQSVTIYPIKSCGGYPVLDSRDWEVRPEGLAWDREWCLLHRGSGQALSQKRCPKMSLLRPILDFERGQLLVTYAGNVPAPKPKSIAVPLSANPSVFQPALPLRSNPSRVCGEEIAAQTYLSDEVNGFFSDVLGVPCVLARFPPGGEGKSMRHSKAHLQKHQGLLKGLSLLAGHSAPPSPPDSDTESSQRRILLSNESPILVINACSLAALNDQIRIRGGTEVSAAVFRANIVIGPADDEPAEYLAYAEDGWSSLRIRHQNFKMLGSCRRCHMVCINQETGEKSEEPFVTLAKTRRFDGKVFFGTHMGHDPSKGVTTREVQFPTIRVGDPVLVNAS